MKALGLIKGALLDWASISEMKYETVVFICKPRDSLVLTLKSKTTVASPSISHSSMFIRLFTTGRELITKSKEVIS